VENNTTIYTTIYATIYIFKKYAIDGVICNHYAFFQGFISAV
jgi:hypothetical protein